MSSDFYIARLVLVEQRRNDPFRAPATGPPSASRHLPDGLSLDPYIDARGHLAIPIAKGRVSFVRKVDAHGCIEFNGAEYFIRRKLERQYVVAALSTHHRRVFIRHEGKLVKSFPFPIPGPIIKPLL